MSDRKEDHIQLTQKSQTPFTNSMQCHYEPLLAGNDVSQTDIGLKFMGFNFNHPLWISSMTGGTALARVINENLARACDEFGIGMGLGSCRSLLSSSDRMSDFSIRKYMPGRPLFMNLGIAQLEEYIVKGEINRISDLAQFLESDGIIIHINPLQEWIQPEGDRYLKPPIETITRLKEQWKSKLIVKEVGQGMGPKSLSALIDLGVDAIEFAAYGGTNFSRLEQLRNPESSMFTQEIVAIGHNASQMIDFLNQIQSSGKTEFIISGGVRGPMHGHELRLLLKHKSIIGMAGQILKHAQDDYEKLRMFLSDFIAHYKLATHLIK